MADWFALPSEVKQIIFSYVPESAHVIYVPRDRRKKIDTRHRESHHFHNLLLVSKTFITPEEFAFAILTRAELVFHSYHETRRFVNEVKTSVKEAVRAITFVRHLTTTGYKNWRDSFEGFSGIATTLSNNFPNLKTIAIVTHPYCAEIGYFGGWSHSTNHYYSLPPSPTQFDDMVSAMLQSEMDGTTVTKETQDDLHLDVKDKILPNVVASCMGDRSTRFGTFAWTRPYAWLRRLVLYAEDVGIEVVIHTELCINSRDCDESTSSSSATVPLASTNICFSRQAWLRKFWLMHVSAEMSTKDYMLRVKHKDFEYKFYQKLAYDLIHSPISKGLSWWTWLCRDMDKGTQPGPFGF